MNTLRLHTPSLAVGIGLAGLLWISLGASPSAAQSPVRVPTQAAGPANVAAMGGAQRLPARDLVYLREGDSFTVPMGRILVLTGIGGGGPDSSSGAVIRTRTVNLEVDGVLTQYMVPNTSVMHTLMTGRPVAGGSTVEVVASQLAEGFFTGYLEDA